MSFVGSVGSGTFGNYRPSKGDDRCLNDLKNINLEDVTRAPYYENNQELPGMMEEVFVYDRLYNGRIAVKSKETTEVIGYVPTRFNYLLSCLERNIEYTGTVVFSINRPIPRIMVDLYAEQK